MAVPDYQSLMLPLLKIASDGEEHGFSEVLGALAVQVKLTDDERKEQLPSPHYSWIYMIVLKTAPIKGSGVV